MRVLNVIASANPAEGGPIEWVRLFGKAAARLGHTTDVVSLDPPGHQTSQDFPLTTFSVGGQFRNFYSRGLVPWLKANAANYDCVIVHGLWRYPSFGTWRALRSSDTPYFVYTHGMLDPWFKHAYPMKHAAKALYWPWTDYRVLRDAAGVIFTCEQERTKAHETFRLFRGHELIATLGVDEPDFDERRVRDDFLARFPHLKGKDILLFLGRIHPKKGCDMLISAYARLAERYPDSHLVFAGPDQTNWIPDLKLQAASLGVEDRLTWAGMLTGTSKWGAFSSASAFVLPSHQENFGIAVVEALSCGVPVLISDNVDIWREIQARDAALVMETDVDSITSALDDWLSMGSARKIEMSTNASQCYEDLFKLTSATSALINLLQTQITKQ